MSSLVGTPPRRAQAGRSPFDSPALLIVLVLVALFGLYDPRSLAPVLDGLSLPDTDDMMRLVGVRDLLAGQGWFDAVQHRMLPPAGIASHWSRLIDLPIAGLILAFTPLLGAKAAEAAAVATWPVLLFLLYGAVAGLGMRRLFGWRVALLVLFVAPQAAVFLNVFRFGRIDHHNAQLCAVLAIALALADPDRRMRRGLLAGVVAGLSLAIGLETLPVIAAAGLIVLADWLRLGERASRMLAGYGAGLFGASVLLFGLQTAPSLWTVPACDALSPPWLLLAAGAAAIGGAALLAERGGMGRTTRCALTALVGAGMAAGFLTIAPACLSGPFAGMDDLVRTSWLDQVDEMRSFPQFLRSEPDVALPTIMPILVATLYAVVMALRERAPDRRRFFIVVAALIVPAALIALGQMRGMYVAGAFVPLLGAIALDRAIVALRMPGSGLHRLALVLLAMAMLSKAWAFVTAQPAGLLAPAAIGAQTGAASNWRTCTAPADYAALDRLPPGLVLGSIDLGPALLLMTRHAVVGAPYHRNLVGMRAAIEASEGSEDTLRQIAQARGADYLLLCTAALDGGQAGGPAPFAADLARGTVPAPDWLTPVTGLPGGSALRAWRIRRE
ncbi:hypothetical protein MKK75_30155 [Methylobacterium sp. J-030]|uniref:hypothetical protein n=1 Tax=Methylobacterium sp. J-030 TaxID=2836627 RepID=UPI001FBB58E9|nr:hypothetical protein [Methylobacterium sp. J-030]MCJ2073009.1 hypothetical protein [Methylobacterium sp. J-030]